MVQPENTASLLCVWSCVYVCAVLYVFCVVRVLYVCCESGVCVVCVHVRTRISVQLGYRHKGCLGRKGRNWRFLIIVDQC